MAYTFYCFRNKRMTALLDEDEWKEIEPLLIDWIKSIQQFRADTGADLETARSKHTRAKAAEQRYFDLTGDTVEHPELLWTLRMSSYGQLCRKCQKPHRTPNARMCAECGAQLPSGQKAGPLRYPRGFQ